MDQDVKNTFETTGLHYHLAKCHHFNFHFFYHKFQVTHTAEKSTNYRKRDQVPLKRADKIKIILKTAGLHYHLTKCLH